MGAVAAPSTVAFAVNGYFSLYKSVILECHALSVDTYINELCVWSIGGCLGQG
jgi:hypothetical protein